MRNLKDFTKLIYEKCFSLPVRKDLKGKINKAFPIKPEFYNLNYWIWVKYPVFLGGAKILIYFKGADSYSYGFDTDERMSDYFNSSPSSHLEVKITKATNDEVKEVLIAEARKRGFDEGVTIVGVGSKNSQTIADPFRYIRVDLMATSINASIPKSEWDENYPPNPHIYMDGVWAKIVDKRAELTLKQIADKFNISELDLRIRDLF